MSLSASMWTSVSGLMAHGEKMNVVGNNIANVSTIGFKSQRMDFADFLYVDKGVASGSDQIGQGVSINAILGDFSQGSFESTNSVTDIAISGEGFFGVRKEGTDNVYYTRAGDFYFNADRELINPASYHLQGWAVDNTKKVAFSNGITSAAGTGVAETPYVGMGAPKDIVLDSWFVKPQRTTNVAFTMGLVNDPQADRTTSSTSPLTALFDSWDGRSEPPLPEEGYATQSSIAVYDEGGSKHTLSVYYDKVEPTRRDSEGNVIYELDGLPANYIVYEYLVTVPPSEDNRSFGGQGFNPETNTWAVEPTKFYDDPNAGTNKNAGVLMSGLMIFDGSGQLVNQTAYTYGATAETMPNNQYDGDPASKTSWQPTKFSSNGLPVFAANFEGMPLANTVSETMQRTATSSPYSQVENYITELDFGLKNANANWDNTKVNQFLRDPAGNMISAHDIDGNPNPVAVGSDRFGYYYLDSGAYGKAEIPGKYAGQDVFSDEIGLYVEGTRNAGTTARVYGQVVNGADTKDVFAENGMLTIEDVNYGDRLTEYYTLGFDSAGNKAVVPVHSGISPYGDFYMGENAHGDKVEAFGKATLPTVSTKELNVEHNAGGYFITNTAGTAFYGQVNTTSAIGENGNLVTFPNDANKRVMFDGAKGQWYATGVTAGGATERAYFTSTSQFTSVAELMTGVSKQKVSLVLPTVTVTTTSNSQPSPMKASMPNTLASLEATPTQADISVAGTPLYKSVVDFSSSVPLMDDPLRMNYASVSSVATPTVREAAQDGYGSGTLNNINIDENGIVSGRYTNGVELNLYQITMYDFNCNQGLYREGGNLYSKTKESGEARYGVAGDNGFGTTKAYNIEQSNVDLAKEFVQMISTQRGFQANSKSITTVDTMLETVIGMKR